MSLDKYENETVAQTNVPIYGTVYRDNRRNETQNHSPPISDQHRTSIYVNQSSIDVNRSPDHVNGGKIYANRQESMNGVQQRPRSAVVVAREAEPEPDYDAGGSDPSGGEEKEEDLASSSFAVMIKQATLNRERRIKERGHLDDVINPKHDVINPKHDNGTPPVVVSSNRNSAVPPPPPPPPPIASSGIPEQSHRRTGSDSGRSVPPEVRKNLDENKKRDEAHLLLMAAVLKRRTLLEGSEDALAETIESRIQKSRKLQVIYRGDQSKQDLTTGPTRPNTLHQSTETNGKSFGNGVTPGNHHATGVDGTNTLAPKKTIPVTTSKHGPVGSSDLAEILVRKSIQRQEAGNTEVPPMEANKGPKRATWNNGQGFVPSPVNHGVANQPYGYARTDVTRYADRFANEDAASTISTLSTLSTLSSLSPENPSSAGSSPPQHQSSFLSKANARNQWHSRIDLSQIPEGVVGVMIPPPVEFQGDEPPTAAPNDQYNALPVTATLRTVNKAPLGNSMVFPARVKDNKAPGNGGGSTSFSERGLESWSVGDVCEWLDSLDYGCYQERFAAMNVAGPRLAQLDENDLQLLGVEQVLHRIKLVREVRKMSKGPGIRLS